MTKGWIGLLLLVGCASRTPVVSALSETTPQTETARLHTWLDAQYAEELRLLPMTKSYLGIKDEDYGRIDDFSEGGLAAQLAFLRASTDQLAARFTRSALSDEGQVSYDLWMVRLEHLEAERAFLRHHFLFEQMAGQQSELPTFLMNIHDVASPQDFEAYVSRIREIGRAIDQLRARAEAAAGDGIHMPAFAYAGALEQARKVVSGVPFTDTGENSSLWGDVVDEVSKLQSAGKVDQATAEALLADARTSLVEELQPAYARLIAWLEEAQANAVAPEAVGAYFLPQGEAYYKERLAFYTTTGLNADEIHALGLREVERLLGEMEQKKAEAGFEGTLKEFFAYLRTDESQFFPNTDEGRQGYLDEAKAHLVAIDETLPTFFGVLPKAELVVRRVEPFREVDGAAQHYVQGTPDGSRPGTYYVHLSDTTALPKSQLEAIAYHEGNPGHHMQTSIAQEGGDTPLFRRQLWYSSYGEGWALYSELLAKEMGGYQDPVSDFGRLTSEMWRALRLVVDTGLHAKGWTEAAAIEYMLAHSSEPEESVRSEVRRYIVWPGQATSYKIGMLKIQELRAQAEAELGDRFDLRGFHDVVLTGGAMPLTLLEARVQRWIARHHE